MLCRAEGLPQARAAGDAAEPPGGVPRLAVVQAGDARRDARTLRRVGGHRAQKPVPGVLRSVGFAPTRGSGGRRLLLARALPPR